MLKYAYIRNTSGVGTVGSYQICGVGGSRVRVNSQEISNFLPIYFDIALLGVNLYMTSLTTFRHSAWDATVLGDSIRQPTRHSYMQCHKYKLTQILVWRRRKKKSPKKHYYSLFYVFYSICEFNLANRSNMQIW